MTDTICAMRAELVRASGGLVQACADLADAWDEAEVAVAEREPTLAAVVRHYRDRAEKYRDALVSVQNAVSPDWSSHIDKVLR
jgi:hypothetical protein